MRAATVLVVVLALAGCGGGDDTQAASPEPSATETAGATASATIQVTSPAFQEGATIPEQHTCRGTGVSPELRWEGVPAGAASVALVVTDPDAPGGTFLHWLVTGIAAEVGGVPADAVPDGAQEGDNSAGTAGWFPPCPPSGTHRYVFTVHALDAPVDGGSSEQVLDAIADRAIASGSLIGLVSAE